MAAPRVRAAATVAGITGMLLLVPGLLWPVPLALACTAVCLPGGRVDRGFELGTRTDKWRGILWLAALTVVVAAAALVGWQHLTGGGVPATYTSIVARTPMPVLVPLGIAFVIVNAAAEEVAFRGIFLNTLQASGMSPAAAIAVQALSFGALHLHGFPSGAIGATLAGFYGVTLGVIRLRSRGLLLPWITHVAADATIVVLVLTR